MLFVAGTILAAGISATAAQLGSGAGNAAPGVLSAAGAAVAALPGAVKEANREVLLPNLEAMAADVGRLAKGAEQQVGCWVVDGGRCM